MNDKDAIIERLTAQMALAHDVRAAAQATSETQSARQRLRGWQVVRLARTHADLLASRRYGKAATFFMTDLYGNSHDLDQREREVERIVPMMTKLLPSSALAAVADAIELDALSEELDRAMVDAIGSRIATMDGADYGRAYRKIGRRAERERLIDLTEQLGTALDRLQDHPFVGAALVTMRRPARMAGLGELQCFLERGYKAFREMGGASEFLKFIVTRERRILEGLFAGDDSVLVVAGG